MSAETLEYINSCY